MLEEHYSAQYHELIRSLAWDIELPIEWRDYFEQRGETSTCSDDERNNQRILVRTYGVLWFERGVPFCPRTREPVGIYTRDFSRQGVGFLTPFQVFPEEQLRVVLPTFWMQLVAVRARRITSRCYEIGAKLLKRHDPSEDAFELSGAALLRDR